ncbi:MAG: hypothetical protein N3E47_00025 [Candidatus Bathyarchaeota archaeon]|nr:hypothetical protein [Candidatus Bathyarchaeota archaeon]
MQTNIFANLIGRNLKDDGGKEVGRIVSFVIDSSGEVKEVLVENKGEDLIKYPVERLKVGQDEVLLVSEIDKRVEEICEKLPVLLKKREILESLFKNKEILPEIYESMSAEFDKAIDNVRVKAQGVLGDIERQIQLQENIIKTLHLARTFLEMEHGIGNIRDDVFRQSLLSILREIKYVSYRKMSLLKTKERVSNLSIRADVSIAADKYVDQKPVMNVRITNE